MFTRNREKHEQPTDKLNPQMYLSGKIYRRTMIHVSRNNAYVVQKLSRIPLKPYLIRWKLTREA